MKELYEEEDSQGLIQVEASNAFNRVNRKNYLLNIQLLCTEITTVTFNCYVKEAKQCFSVWSNAKSLKVKDYHLSKIEFSDALSLRYGFRMKSEGVAAFVKGYNLS